MKKKWLHIVTKTRFGTVKATSKKVVQKVAEATQKLIWNKIDVNIVKTKTCVWFVLKKTLKK